MVSPSSPPIAMTTFQAPLTQQKTPSISPPMCSSRFWKKGFPQRASAAGSRKALTILPISSTMPKMRARWRPPRRKMPPAGSWLQAKSPICLDTRSGGPPPFSPPQTFPAALSMTAPGRCGRRPSRATSTARRFPSSTWPLPQAGCPPAAKVATCPGTTSWATRLSTPPPKKTGRKKPSPPRL